VKINSLRSQANAKPTDLLYFLEYRSVLAQERSFLDSS
jgi:hypothetical protein